MDFLKAAKEKAEEKIADKGQELADIGKEGMGAFSDIKDGLINGNLQEIAGGLTKGMDAFDKAKEQYNDAKEVYDKGKEMIETYNNNSRNEQGCTSGDIWEANTPLCKCCCCFKCCPGIRLFCYHLSKAAKQKEQDFENSVESRFCCCDCCIGWLWCCFTLK